MRGASSRILEGAIGSVYGSAYAQLEHYSNLKKQIHFIMDLVLGATYRVSGTFRDTSGEYQILQAAYISIGTAQASQVRSKDFVMTQYIHSISINVNP